MVVEGCCHKALASVCLERMQAVETREASEESDGDENSGASPTWASFIAFEVSSSNPQSSLSFFTLARLSSCKLLITFFTTIKVKGCEV